MAGRNGPGEEGKMDGSLTEDGVRGWGEAGGVGPLMSTPKIKVLLSPKPTNKKSFKFNSDLEQRYSRSCIPTAGPKGLHNLVPLTDEASLKESSPGLKTINPRPTRIYFLCVTHQ